MNIAEGLKRIYIVLSCFWAAFFLFIGITDKEILASLIIGVLIPILLYFIICWIIKGFKNG